MTRWGLVTLLFVLSGCAQHELDALRADQAKLAQRIDALEKARAEDAKLTARVDAVEQWQQQLKERIAAAARRDNDEDENKVFAVPVGDSPVRGPSDAWVTIVEFSDFQCPFCAKAQPTLSALHDKYGDSVRVVWKNLPLPFHPMARPAAMAAMCAGPKFWAMHDTFFKHQDELDDAFVIKAAKQAGVDNKHWKECFEHDGAAVQLDADAKLAEEVGASGTPTFFINGHKLVGAQPLQRFERVIDEALAKAKQSGVPAKEYYEKEIVQKGSH